MSIKSVEIDCIRTVKRCPKCGKYYELAIYDQTPGYRDDSYEICPHCHSIISKSMEREFFTYPLGVYEDE